MTHYNKHSDIEKATAIARVMYGEQQVVVAEDMGFKQRTLKLLMQKHRQGLPITNKRRGPAPALHVDCEDAIASWVVAMQRDAYPVDRYDVILKAQEVCRSLGIPPVKDGWYKRFRERHPDLVSRISQVICRTRNEVDEGSIYRLFSTMAKLVIEGKFDASRVFNIDETSFATRKKSKKVLALRGSKSVHSKNFHLTIVACCSAAGFVVPPLFIMPGQRLSADIMSECTIDGAHVTTSTSGFINGALFVKWIDMLAASVPNTVARPIILVCDEYLSHFSEPDVVDHLETHKIKLVCLPANGTHLVQPLDVAVFGPFKRKLRNEIRNHMLATASTSITKPLAMRIASVAWATGMCGTSAVAGFKACGIFPPSIAAMNARLHRFKDGGARVMEQAAAWAQEKEHIRTTVLVLPPATSTGQRKRKTVDVAGRLVTRELVEKELSGGAKMKRKPTRVDEEDFVDN
ncbi:hypothetical protein ACHHYP_14730 [Achlya hypogyna]|uniref:HTH CENPB-type domain-containing protein n=1 Tax=Achlya hypogyna TaxID=1202772 RepID=A0A1V9YCI2_ACHHY|nr:hypothetical protein ACHHYP_14730 [Achlya hypogyna]